MLSSLTLVAAALASVQAHSIFQRLYVNGVDQGHLKGIRYPTYDGPITDVTSSDVICNGGPNPLTTPYPTDIINIPAGASVTAEWHHVLQPNGYNSGDAADPIDASHKGPIMVYMAKVSSATQQSVSGLGWFKIYEDGLSGGVWAVDKLITNKGKHSFTIPSCIAPGNYFLRVELIALHAAGSYPGAQLYMECAQINITGGGSSSPSTVSFPGAYSGSDPGIKYNLYGGLTTYTIPGPRPFTCSGTQPQSSNPPPASSTARTSSTVKPASSSSSAKPATSSTSSGCTVAKYGQCGGQGYTGCTVCTGSTCTKSNDFYSQCL